jgi:hypothetical protein
VKVFAGLILIYIYIDIILVSHKGLENVHFVEKLIQGNIQNQQCCEAHPKTNSEHFVKDAHGARFQLENYLHTDTCNQHTYFEQILVLIIETMSLGWK